MDEVSYARAGEAHIAYRVFEGDGTVDVVMVAAMFFSMDLLAEDRVAARFIEGLAALGRLVVFDKRGIGLSDPVTDWTRPVHEQWADDLSAVIDAAGLDAPVVVSWDYLGVARLVAARQPTAIGRLVLMNPIDAIDAIVRRFSEAADEAGDDWLEVLERAAFPSRTHEPAFWDWLTKAGRVGASPATAHRYWGNVLAITGSLTPAGVAASTLVIHRRDCLVSERAARAVAAAIPNAEFVQLLGADLYPLSGDVDAVVAEIAAFVTGSVQLPAPERSIAVVLFTDLVGSTERAAGEGDDRWRGLLDVHDTIVRRCVERGGGTVVKYTGDGVLGLMPSATGALRAARAIQELLAEHGVEIRAGVHVGDIDRRGDDVSGLVVNVAARIMSQADSNEVLVSESIRRATIGSALTFTDARTVSLKGVPERWEIHRWVPTT